MKNILFLMLTTLVLCSACTKEDRLVPMEQGTNPPVVYQGLVYEVFYCPDLENDPRCSTASPIVNAVVTLYTSDVDRENDWQPIVARTGEDGKIVLSSLRGQSYYVRVSTQYGSEDIYQSIPYGGKSFRSFYFY